VKDNNTLKACYFYIKDGEIKLKPKEYFWHIPKSLRAENIQVGDYILVRGFGKEQKEKDKKLIVTDVFREDIEDTGKHYKPILGKTKPVVIKEKKNKEQ
jgi:hypothetical protein